MTKKRVLLFLAKNNFSESGFLIITSTLKKAGISYSIVSDTENWCTGDCRAKVIPDVKMFNVNPFNYSAIIIICGSGILEYRKNNTVLEIIRKFHRAGKIIAAVCLGPVLLAEAEILGNSPVSVHSTGIKELLQRKVVINNNSISQSGNIYTSDGIHSCSEMVYRIIQNL